LPLVPREKIDAVRERTNIVEIVKRHVELRRAGTVSWKGLCPFHTEKTPSFHLNEARQYFHCFGCGEKGGVFDFLMKIEQRSFKEVLADLAQAAGVDLPQKALTPAERHALSEAESERERMLRVMEMAATYFEEQYASPAGAAARAYVEGRGLSARTVERFRVGYAPPGWSHLQGFLSSRKTPPQVVERLGLVRMGERGPYDFFRDRVMLPVIDRQKRVVGFSSRLLDPDAKEGKYVNSPDSPLFHKKEQLYGLHAALDAIRKGGTAIVVEGNFDVMSLYDAGIEEAVAPMGTALTTEQVVMLARIARRAVVVFDGDAAGQRAARKAIPLFVAADADGRVARMPPGVDPDDFVRAQGAAAFRKLVDGARPVMEQLIDDVGGESGLTIPDKVQAMEQAIPLLVQVKNPTARELYAGRLATALGIAPAQVARALRGAAYPQRLKEDLQRRATGGGAAGDSTEGTTAVPARIPPRDEMEVLALLSARPTIAPAMETSRILDLLVDPGVRQLLRSALQAVRDTGRLDVPEWLDSGPADVRAAAATAAMDGRYTGAEDAERILRSLHARLTRVRIDHEIAAHHVQHREALARGDDEAARAIGLREIELIRTKQGLQETRERP